MVLPCQGRRLCGCKGFSSSLRGSQGCSHIPEQVLGHQEWCSGLRRAFISIHPAAGRSYPCSWARSASADTQNASGNCPVSEKHREPCPMLNITELLLHMGNSLSPISPQPGETKSPSTPTGATGPVLAGARCGYYGSCG